MKHNEWWSIRVVVQNTALGPSTPLCKKATSNNSRVRLALVDLHSIFVVFDALELGWFDWDERNDEAQRQRWVQACFDEPNPGHRPDDKHVELPLLDLELPQTKGQSHRQQNYQKIDWLNRCQWVVVVGLHP